MDDGIISMLLDRLLSTVYEYVAGEVKLVLDAKEDVEEFAGNLRAIHAVLEDAEQRQVKDASVRIWLDQLKDISLQMVDVLDEWNTDMLRQQVDKQEREGEDVVPEEKKKKKKVTLSVSCSCFCSRKAKEVIFRRDIASKIKDLNGRLRKIDVQRKRYEFQHIERGIQELPERQKTSSFVVVSEVFGREKEKDILITKLLSDGGEDRRGILIIPILGMGGMGKTTLAQLAYNDDKVKAYFEKREWVCVSDPFDEIKIAKAICGDNAPNSNELDHALQHMSTSIEGKRFLLVLDDVWTQDRRKWEILRAPLIQSGAHGSKILVTTRKHEVVDMMRAKSEMINLGKLSEECCLSIFNHMAFVDMEVEESNAFEDISRDIVKKCKGLPLAAKALGSLMYNKKTRREWMDVLNSKIWDREEVEQEVFQPLFLSYYDLVPAVKCCLLYCASFPKDYDFTRDELISLWMAQDYLNSKGNPDEEEVGQAIFDNLVARSFFQDWEKDIVSGKITGCKMHDIVHDFVQSLTKDECLITEDVDSEIEGLGEKVRHLTITFRSNRGESLLFPPSNAYYNCKNIRSLSYFYSSITTIDSNFILQLKCLRTLNLRCSGISEVPKEIGELMHLRHIDLSWNVGLKILPDSICELYNLYTLRLSDCDSLEKLPDNMGKLISLKHLYVNGCYELEFLPQGIRRLKKLKRIDGACVVVCGEDEGRAALQVGDLGVLNLEGSFIIKLKGNVKDERELEKAQLWDMKKLFHLEIDSKHVQNKQTISTVEILNGLRPHKNLESLKIYGHSGTTCPNWMMSLHNLRIISLYGWSECKLLPPLGKLPYLEKLILHVMEKVEKIGGEFLGIVDSDETSLTSSSSTSFFPKLKEFHIRFMDALVDWEVGVEGWNKEDSEISIMPCLSSLRIDYCKAIKTLPNFLCKTPLQDLLIMGCPMLSERCKQDSGEEWHKISHIPNIEIEI